ncbi:MAG: Gfo/Idh/MocA family oxidoreductase, partial [Candidatus Latescibacteria bacterium]|nr:Gfo/Idh/MocA family oxidoreductase [Candidatus Latescibacterota bacterium]
ELNIGMIGYSFMGKAHSNGFRQVPAFFPELDVKPVLKVICGRNRDAVKDAAETYGWEEYETSWRKVIARDDIDVVDICTPGNQHLPMALAALNAGKHVICEKPLTNTLKEAKELLKVSNKTRKKTMVAFNYRRVPAVALAKQLISEGRIGEIFHWRAVYLQDWIIDPDFPLVWRLQKSKAGSGPHGDLNAHIIDLALHLVGDIDTVVGADTTFIKERPIEEATDAALGAKGGSKKGRVTVDDAMMFLARFKNGAMGTFEATRFAAGRRNYNHFEINGSKGSITFDLQKMGELQYFSRDDENHIQGFREIIVGEGSQPYVGAWWPPGHIIGWEHTFTHQFRDFFEAITKNRKFSPDFTEGTKVQAVLEAVVDSAKSKKW